MTTAVATKSKVRRLAGGILAETNGEYYLIGELKEPCDFALLGFEKPTESDENNRLPYRKLINGGDGFKPSQTFASENDHYLEMETEGEALAQLLFKRFIIHRNNSISNRLWNVVTCDMDEGTVDARWLEQMPDDVWDVIRDTILKCV